VSRWRFLVTVGALISAMSASLAAPNLVGAQVAGGAGISYWLPGFDDCRLPSTSMMQTWWADSPYWFYGVYIGGQNLAGPGQGCDPLPSA
jgi:hypothetical protein